MSYQQPKRRKFDHPAQQNNQREPSREGHNSGYMQNKDTRQNKSEERLCKLCNKQWHNSLFYCSKFPEFIPRGKNARRIPQIVCTKCLSIGFPTCDHRKLPNYKDLLCKYNNINYLLCNQCQNHTITQDWVKENFDLQIGRKILLKARNTIPNHDATI